MKSTTLLATTLLVSATLSAPAFASPVYLGNFSGNDCGGQGGFSNCYATQNGTQQGPSTDPLASPSVIKFDAGGTTDISTLFPSVDGSEFTIDFNAQANTLSFTYAAGLNDPTLHYFAAKQTNAYALFYDATAITAGTVNLSTYFPNNPGYSHITFFDTNGGPGPGPGPIPEPASLAIFGAGLLGLGLARRRKVHPQA